MPDKFALAVCYLAFAIASWKAVDWVRRCALRFHLLDVPNERSSHSRPVPLGGGIVIVLFNVIAWLAAGFFPPVELMERRHALTFVLAGMLIATVSLLDDIRPVQYPVRLGVHLVAATLFVWGYCAWNAVAVPMLGTVALGSLGIVLTVVWIAGLTNAFNFIDGIDGIACSLSVSAGIGWMVLGSFTHLPAETVLGGLLAASSLGFLPHNWQPAGIFMGDVGATFLGFSFACLTVVAAEHDSRLALAGVLLVWPAVFDSGFTVLRRMLDRQPILAGHKTFLFHRLVGSGWSHAKAATLYFWLPALGAPLAVAWAEGNIVVRDFVAIASICLCVSLWLLVRHEEKRAMGGALPAGLTDVVVSTEIELEPAELTGD